MVSRQSSIDEFPRRGYAIINGVIEPQRCARVVEDLGRIGIKRSRAGIRHAMSHLVLRELAQDSRLLEIARESAGPKASPIRATLFDKSPGSNWLVAWHQDTALPMRAKHERNGWGPWSVKENVIYAHAPAAALSQIVALRIHLDDSTTENGPLRVLPMTQSRGVLSDLESRALAAEIEAVDCPVPRGGVLAMRPLIIHASSKSRSSQSRRVLHIEYAPSRDFVDAMGIAVA